MANKLFVPATVLVSALSLTHAQSIDNNPAHAPDVFLSNHKPSKKDKAATSRTVTGMVTDETGQPLNGALVTLIDSKTKEKTSYFTKKDGRYRFEDLAFTNDYEVQARWKSYNSEPRKLSQFDHTANPVRILEVQTETPPAPAATASSQPSTTPKQ